MPASRFTKCPKLDKTLKSKLPKHCKDTEWPLAKTQALLLEAVGPLAHLVQDLPQDIAEAVALSLKFFNDASATISNERHRCTGSFFNEDLKCLIEEDDQFKDAAPLLFGNGFLSTAKDHAESMKVLDKMSTGTAEALDNSFFGIVTPSIKLPEGAAATSLAATEAPTTRVSAVPSEEEEDTDPIRGRMPGQTAERAQSSTSRDIRDSVTHCSPEIVYVYHNLPLVSCMLHAKTFFSITHSVAAQEAREYET